MWVHVRTCECGWLHTYVYWYSCIYITRACALLTMSCIGTCDFITVSWNSILSHQSCHMYACFFLSHLFKIINLGFTCSYWWFSVYNYIILESSYMKNSDVTTTTNSYCMHSTAWRFGRFDAYSQLWWGLTVILLGIYLS